MSFWKDLGVRWVLCYRRCSQNFLLEVFGFSVPCLHCPFSFPSLSSALSSRWHYHLFPATHTDTHTQTHTHRHTHITTEGESDPGFSGYGALCRTEIEECETDTNPHSAFSPNIRTMCPPTSCCCLVTKSRLTLCDPMNSSPPGSSVHGISPGMITGVGCHFLLQGILPTQGSKLHLLQWEVDSLPLSRQGSPHFC